jgi:hypothetical protein
MDPIWRQLDAALALARGGRAAATARMESLRASKPNLRIGGKRANSHQFGPRWEGNTKRLIVATTVFMFAVGGAFAQEACETKAVGKDGKPLAGAAKTSFMKKCQTDACEAKAVSSDGKKLAGAAKTSFMKKCKAAA